MNPSSKSVIDALFRECGHVDGVCQDCVHRFCVALWENAEREIAAAVEAEKKRCAEHLRELIEHGKKALADVEQAPVWPAGHAYKFTYARGWVAALVHAADALGARGAK